MSTEHAVPVRNRRDQCEDTETHFQPVILKDAAERADAIDQSPERYRAETG